MPAPEKHTLELEADDIELASTIVVESPQSPPIRGSVGPADKGYFLKTTKMAPLKDAKRKATEEPGTPSDHKRIKRSESEQVALPKEHVAKPIPFPKKVSPLSSNFLLEYESRIVVQPIYKWGLVFL